MSQADIPSMMVSRMPPPPAVVARRLLVVSARTGVDAGTVSDGVPVDTGVGMSVTFAVTDGVDGVELDTCVLVSSEGVTDGLKDRVNVASGDCDEVAVMSPSFSDGDRRGEDGSASEEGGLDGERADGDIVKETIEEDRGLKSSIESADVATSESSLLIEGATSIRVVADGDKGLFMSVAEAVPANTTALVGLIAMLVAMTTSGSSAEVAEVSSSNDSSKFISSEVSVTVIELSVESMRDGVSVVESLACVGEAMGDGISVVESLACVGEAMGDGVSVVESLACVGEAMRDGVSVVESLACVEVDCNEIEVSGISTKIEGNVEVVAVSESSSKRSEREDGICIMISEASITSAVVSVRR